MSRSPGERRRRVLVVDDSAFVRTALTSMIRSHPELEVAGQAADGEEAIRQALRLRPHLVVLDLGLPRVGGLGFLRWLMRHQPVPVLIVTGARGGREVLRALELGALDYILKPTAQASEQFFDIREELLRKILALAAAPEQRLSGEPVSGAAEPAIRQAPEVRQRPSCDGLPLVVIGASTGGPPAVQFVLTALPGRWSGTILVAQHMPGTFTRIFAERLNRLAALEIAEARNGETLRPGRCLILPGGKQGEVEAQGNRLRLRLSEREEEDRYSPSVDRLFASAAAAAGARVTAVVLTGMGEDGAEGVRSVRQHGGWTMAESGDSAVIFGMPQAAIRSGGVDEVLSLQDIARRLRGLAPEVDEPAGVGAGSGAARRGADSNGRGGGRGL
jgi:two-component system chemotaxis response regulator CheB